MFRMTARGVGSVWEIRFCSFVACSLLIETGHLIMTTRCIPRSRIPTPLPSLSPPPPPNSGFH